MFKDTKRDNQNPRMEEQTAQCPEEKKKRKRPIMVTKSEN